MQYRNTLLAAVGALLFVASAAQAETGKVVDTDATMKTFTIETDAGTQLVFGVDDATTFRSGDRTIGLGDLPLGTRVDVSADAAVGTDRRVAREIEVRDAVVEATPRASDPDMADTAARDERMDVAANRLPDTASPVLLFGILGSASLVLGLALRRRR